MKNWIKLSLIFIVFLGFTLRVYKLSSIPPSLNWDETAAAYNAFTIKNWGMDEWGKKFPLVFTSFRDDKHPVHIYATALVYTFLGVSDFTTRLPSVLIGVAAIIFVYLLTSTLTENKIAGLFASLFLAVSPYAIHYSRGLWEANFAIGFYLLGLGSFCYGLAKRRPFVILAYLFFGLSLLSYHAAKIVVPPTVFLLTLLYCKDLLKIKKQFFAGIVIFTIFMGTLFIEPRLLGIARMAQTKLDPKLIQNTFLYQKTNNELLGRLEVSAQYYKKYFTYDYLFKRGDQEPRGSVKTLGEFYKINLILVPLGIIFLIHKRKWKFLLAWFLWFFFAPIPGALSGANPNSTRAIFMLGTFEIASGIGIALILYLVKNVNLLLFFSLLILAALGYETTTYLKYYFSQYSKNEAIQWQYGMQQVVNFAAKNPEYDEVYVTKLRSQPYIFFLYYLRYPLPKLLESVKYDETGSKSYNTIESFGKYRFGNWDYVESKPESDILYIVTGNEFTGFRYGSSFNVKEVVKFPGRDDAFYIVSAF